MEKGRILALDYGTKNIGLAYSDDLGLTVQPLQSIPNSGRKSLIQNLRSAVAEHSISSILVGIPYRLDGSSGRAVEKVDRFIELIRNSLDLTVAGFDERLSTSEALDIWNGMSIRQKRRYRTVDSLAAALILERFLEET
jgi:putative holliday junction resolvase